MKKFTALLAAASFLVIALSGVAQAQIGVYSSADVLEKDAADVGATLVVGSVGFLGHVRYGVSPEIDIGAKAGIINGGNVTRFYTGIDARYAYMRADDGDEVDVNFLGTFQLNTGSDVTGWFIGAGGQFGKTFPFSDSDMTLSPYGGLVLGVAHLSIGDASASDFGGLIPLGAELAFQENLSGMFEIDVFFADNSDVLIAFGINYAYK
jgi:hypothetical protein